MSKRMIAFFAWGLLLVGLFLTTLCVFEVVAIGPELHWQKASYALEPGRYAHSLIENRGKLYILGGKEVYVPSDPNQGLPVETILCSRIVSGNGDITPWRQAATFMNTPVSDAAVVNAQDFIYIVGGRDASGSPINKVQVVNVDLCDKTQEWQYQNPTILPKLEKSAAAYYDGAIYVVGGRDENYNIRPEVYSAVITAPGQLPDWRIAADDGPALFNHTLFAANGYLYLVGGVSSLGTERSMYRAEIISSGLISDWFTLPITNSLITPLSTLRAVVVNDRAYIIGGHNSGVFTDQVWSAELYADGSVEPWKPENKLPQVINWHSAVMASNGSIYVTGGLTHLEQLQPSTFYFPPLSFTKTNAPPGPVHEGDVITYTLAYANTSLITQTITITDVLPYNLQYIPGSASSTPTITEKTLVWAIGNVSPGDGGEITFQTRVALLPSLQQAAIEAACPNQPPPPAYVLPAPIACDTTRFWANGVTRQPPEPNPHTIIVQIPPGANPSGANPSAMWLLMKGIDNTPPTVEGVSADLLATTNNIIGASLFTAAVTPAMIDQGEITVVTYNPDKLNAIFLFNEDDPPFEVAALNDFYDTTATTTYTLEMPSVLTETMDVILPFMDITYWNDDNLPDDRITEVTVQYDDQPPQTVRANQPNLGNGLLMTQFAFNVTPLPDPITVTKKILTVTVDTEDSIYTLGPRVCRPVYIENTALLCSTQAGCISDTAKNIPENFNPYGGIYLPIIMKNSS